MEKIIKGYKCFYKGLSNIYNTKFELNKLYIAKGTIKYGVDGNGFHMCENLEDTLRFFDKTKELEICEVIGFGEKVKYNDEYYDYYNMFSVEKLYISRIIPRKEIIDIGLNLHELRIIRFLQGYKLTKEEIEMFKEKFYYNNRILKYISYYQEENKDAFKLKKIK